MRERGIFFALLAGMGAITYHSTSNPETTSQQTQTTNASSQRSGASESEMAKTFEDFDKLHKFTIIHTTDGLNLKPTPNNESDAPRYKWLLATIPDPEHSNLKLYFDRELESLQWAAAKAGYQFERFWLPWKTEVESRKEASYEIGLSSGNADDKSKILRVAPEQDDRNGLPGVLLFRNRRGVPLVVFLVSESPIAGVAPEEFRNAVRLGRTLGGASSTPDDAPLRIIGPCLSGSLAPLGTLINNLASSQRIFVRSWTHDEESNQQFHRLVPTANFQSVVVSSNEATNRFVSYVQTEWHDKAPILLLTEESTAFGGGVTKEDNKKEGNKQSVYTVPFPRNLSQLRNASEKQDHFPGVGDASRRSDIPRNGIWMSLKQEARADLELPAFSREQTPVSQESVLFTIGDLLKTGAIHYVGIYATDPLDTLFLARYLRSVCPNVRTFTLHSDLLFEHGSDSSDYAGLLELSDFPLFPLSQVWAANGPVHPLYVFPDGVAEAVYNAALEVLHEIPGNELHDRQPNKIDTRDRVDPFSHATNSVWLTVAGKSGFEPLAVLNQTERHGTTKRKIITGHFPPEYWPGWGYAFLTLVSLCFAFCLLMLFARLTGRRILAFFSPQLDRDDLSGKYNPVPRAFYLLSIGMCLSSLLEAWTVVPAFILQWNVTSEFQLKIVSLFLGVAGAIIVLAFRFVFGVPDPSAKSRFRVKGIAGLHPVGAASVFAIPAPLVWVMSLAPPLPEQPTHVLAYLWWFFCIGSFCIGATIAASALPFWNILETTTRQNGPSRKTLRNTFAVPYSWGIVSVVAFLALTIVVGIISIDEHEPSHFLAAYRSLDLTNGVSPLVPLTLLFTALAILAFVQLRRMTYYEERRPEIPGMSDLVHPRLKSLAAEINNRIRKFTIHPLHWLMLAVVLLFSWRLLLGPAQTLEGRPLELLLLSAAISVSTFIILIWIRLVLVWSAFSQFLQQLERHPIRQVFSLLPRGFIWSPAWQGGGKKRTHVLITRSVECIEALVHHPRTPQSMKDEIRKRLDTRLAVDVKSLLRRAAMRRRIPRATYQGIEEKLRDVAELAVAYLNKTTWCWGDYELKTELASKEETKDALHTPRPEYLKQEPATICSELVAFRLLAFINFVLWHVDNLVAYISVGFLLLAVALNSYAFRSRTNIEWLMTVLFLVLTAGIVVVFAQADRDAILSRITGTEEGKLDRHFFTHLISYGGVPALVLLATHFPTVGRFFFSWVKPALEAIH